MLSFVGLLLGSCNFTSKGFSTGQVFSAGKTMKLESVSFSVNGMIPPKYTCHGQNISPPLSWNEPPAGTQSLTLIVDDPDAPNGIFVHWVVYNISVQNRQMPEAIPRQPTLIDAREIEDGVQGKNDFGQLGYGGPCPPSGTHRYFFKLYALDRQLSLKPGATKTQVLAAMNGHVLATGKLVGRYQHQ